MSPSEVPGRTAADAGALARLARTDADRFRAEMARSSERDQVLKVLAMEPGDRIPALLNAPRAMRLVRSVPAPDLYLTIRETGPVDAVPVLALASREQLQHVLDLESWRGDRFDGLRAGAWAAVLVEAGASTLRRFLQAADDAEVALLLQSWARLEEIEIDDQVPVHGHGQTESGDERGFVTPDGNHRVRVEIPEHAPAARTVLERLFQDDPARYQRVVWAAVSELPAQLEEDALRWRGSRLEEHGYVPFDEAVTVYALPAATPEPPPAIDLDVDTAIPAPRFPEGQAPPAGRLAGALSDADPGRAESILRQWIAVASRIVVADGLDTGDPRSLVRAVRKAAGGAEIGLAAVEPGTDPTAALDRVAFIEWFRRGHAEIAALKRRAHALLERGWASVHTGALDLLDPPIRPRIEGLLLDRPCWYSLDAKRADEAFREFRVPEEVEETRGAVELAETVGTLFVDRLGLDVPRVLADAAARSRDVPRFSTLLATLLAWSAARDEVTLAPLPGDVVADFLREVASRRTAPPDAPERALDALVGRIEARARLDPRERGVFHGFGRACLERVAEECGGLDPGAPVDDRHVTCLWLADPTASEEGR